MTLAYISLPMSYSWIIWTYVVPQLGLTRFETTVLVGRWIALCGCEYLLCSWNDSSTNFSSIFFPASKKKLTGPCSRRAVFLKNLGRQSPLAVGMVWTGSRPVCICMCLYEPLVSRVDWIISHCSWLSLWINKNIGIGLYAVGFNSWYVCDYFYWCFSISFFFHP